MMTEVFKKCLWQNFGAAIDMLRNAISLCPDELWQRKDKFFYMTYHVSIFLDYYLTQPVKNFKPALTFTIIDFDRLPTTAIDDVIPDQHYSKEQLLDWLIACREKCHDLIMNSGEDKLKGKWIEPNEINLHGLCPSIVENYSLLEILFYNIRHVQHHVAQMNFILRSEADVAADWISLAEL